MLKSTLQVLGVVTLTILMLTGFDFVYLTTKEVLHGHLCSITSNEAEAVSDSEDYPVASYDPDKGRKGLLRYVPGLFR